MNLILYLNLNKLPSTYNGPYNKYPFTQIVNRVIPNKYEPFNVKSVLVNPLDIYNSSYYTFEECVSKSVERFENTNKPLYVKYSGGTDSTLALLSLWNFGSQDLKDRLHLILSVDSIKEFPELFPFIKENFKNKIFYSTNPIKPLLNKGIIITGESGDQLYGSSMMKKIIDSSNYNDTRILNLPWYEVIPNFIQKNISKEINGLLLACHGTKEQNLIDTLTLRCMSKAVYTTQNIGHYGLAFSHYTHFTSPIRRYPDVLVHRLLQMYLDGESSAKESTLEEACEHSSQREQLATKAERDSIKHMQMVFMEDKVGQEYDGVISGVTDRGIYVEIVENKCEGMIRVMDIKGDYFQYDMDRHALVGERTKKIYQLGDEIKIKVKKVNVIKRFLDFVPLN